MGQPVEMARPGWRTAVNLRGVKKDDLTRGDALATPGVLRPTRLLDAELTLLATAAKPLKRGQTCPFALRHGRNARPRVSAGAGSHRARRDGAWCSFVWPKTRLFPFGEPFILRTPSPAETIGGGVVIDPYPQKHTRADDDCSAARSNVLAQGSPSEKLGEKLREAGPAGRNLSELLLDLGLTDAPIADSPLILCSGGLALHPEVFDALQVQASEAVHRFHEAHPLRRGMPLEELRRGLPRTLPACRISSAAGNADRSGRIGNTGRSGA